MMTTRLKALAIAAILAVVACSTTQPRSTAVEPRVANPAEITRVLTREYPPELETAGIGGTVTVRLFIDTLGIVRNSLLEKSSGYFELDRAALRAVSFFKFIPANNKGEKVAVWILMPVHFFVRVPVTFGMRATPGSNYRDRFWQQA